MVMKSSAVTSPAKSEELKYKGVRKRKWGKWVTEIRQPHSRERIWLGSYDSPEKAARAFDAAQICLRGPSAANLNFPDNPPELDVVPGLCPAQIQLIASKFANTPPPPPTPSSSLSLSDANESSFDDGPALFTFDDHCSGFGLPEFYTYQYDEVDDQWNDTASDDLWLWNF